MSQYHWHFDIFLRHVFLVWKYFLRISHCPSCHTYPLNPSRIQPRPRTRSSASNSGEESTPPPVEKSRKSSVIEAGVDNKKKQNDRVKVVASKVTGAEKPFKKSTNKSGLKKLSPKTDLKSGAKSVVKSPSHIAATKTSPRTPSKRKSQAEKSPDKKSTMNPVEIIDPPKGRDEEDSAEVTAADLGLELTDDGDGIEVELAKVEAEEVNEALVTKQEEISRFGTVYANFMFSTIFSVITTFTILSSSIGNINTSVESGKVDTPKSDKQKKKKRKGKEEKRDKEERRNEKRMERERRRTQERVRLLKEMSSDPSLFGMENQNVFDVRHDD